MAWALTLGATIVGAVNSMNQGEAAQGAADYNAAVATQNAIVAQQNARVDMEAKRRDTARRLSAGVAAIGASGITIEGTPLDLLAEEAEMGELDALTIQYNGEMQARGFRSDAVLERSRGKNARNTGYLNAAGTLLSGASKAMSQFAGSSVGVS